MHNLHFLVVKAESGKKACSIAENYIMDFGTENNWRTICGAVSEKDEVYIEDENGYPPDENSNTIAKINEKVFKWVHSESYYRTSFEKLIKDGEDKMDSLDWFSLMQYAEEQMEKCNALQSDSIDVLDESFSYFSYKYDECGVTQYETYLNKNMDDDNLQKWVVFIDMHS